jgi:hypothetical protein
MLDITRLDIDFPVAGRYPKGTVIEEHALPKNKAQ